jgi:hypothetical protein
MEIDDEGVATNVFNASDSVWLAFTHNLYDAQKALYKALWDNGAWSAEDYLNEFKDLPKRLQTAEFMKKLDTDNSGFIESKNSKGQNETWGLAWLLGCFIDKSNIVKVEREAGEAETFTAYDENDNIVQCNINYSDGAKDIKRDGVTKRYSSNDELEVVKQGGYKAFYEDGKKHYSCRNSSAGFGAYLNDSTFNENEQLTEVTTQEIFYTGSNNLVAITKEERYVYNDDNSVDVFVSDTVAEPKIRGTLHHVRNEQKLTDDIIKVRENDTVYYKKNGEPIEETEVMQELQEIEQEPNSNSEEPWYKKLYNLKK